MTKPIKVGVVGCGYWGPNLIRNFRSLPDCNMKMMCDVSENRLTHLKSLYPEVEGETNYNHMLIGGVLQIAETRRCFGQSFRTGKWQSLDATNPGTSHTHINCRNRKEKDFAPGRQEAAIEASGACPTNSYMNTLLEAPAHEVETVDLRHDDVGVIRKANGSPPNQGRSKLR
jgi:hypothetical protein